MSSFFYLELFYIISPEVLDFATNLREKALIGQFEDENSDSDTKSPLSVTF